MAIKQRLQELKYLWPLQAARVEAQDVVPGAPVINTRHPAYDVITVYKRQPCENRKGFGWSGRVIEVHVKDKVGECLEGIKLVFTPAYGHGIASERPPIWGVTDGNGYLEYVHPQRVTCWTLVVEDIWLVDGLWANQRPTYCNPAPWPPQGYQFRNWRPAEEPGDGSYRIEITRKW